MKPKEPVNILMVDDQPAKLLSYETILAELGENLIRANSGREALGQLLKDEIAVVLVDVCMPELDGYELALMIRSHPRFKKTAIILVSGVLVEDQDRLKGYVSGAVDYVSVPIVPEILRAKVAVFADLYRKTGELERLNQDLERRVREATAEIEASASLLRQSEERFRLLVENVQDYSILMLDPEGRIGTWNTGTERLYGYRAEEIVGCHFSHFLPPEDRKSNKPGYLLQTASRHGHCEDEGWRVRKNGSRFWANVMITALRDAQGRLLGFSKIVHDVTERKRAEEERASLLKNAQDARRESERANRLKDEFLAILSHELRTPLNAITGWAHMLQAGGLDQETQTKAIETINRNALLQARLISDLLDVSRIVSGKLRLDLRPVELSSIIHAALDTVRPTVESKEIRIDVAMTPHPVPVRGDAARLQQVISNLLSNATKFAPGQGHIRISLDTVGSNAEVKVQDDGPGIPPDFLPHIFEPFRQGDASNMRSHQGLGLGLAIVRNLLEMHGGSVQAMNREDRPGAIFKFVLPLNADGVEAASSRQAPAPPADEVNWIQAAPSLKNIRVLVVDDQSDAREVVALILERCDAQVRVAASAAEAFAILEQESAEVLVADIEMPGEDGYSLLRRIRALAPDRGGRTPAIALTAHAGAQDRTKLLAAGFQRHVPKPLQPLELVSAIWNLAGQSRDLAGEAVSQVRAASEGG